MRYQFCGCVEVCATIEVSNSKHCAIRLGQTVCSSYSLEKAVVSARSVVLIGGLTLVGLTADMNVNVEFNIGEILGALLVGIGVAAAGVSYDTRDSQLEGEQDEG